LQPKKKKWTCEAPPTNVIYPRELEIKENKESLVLGDATNIAGSKMRGGSIPHREARLSTEE
jgi:hypothetical protein